MSLSFPGDGFEHSLSGPRGGAPANAGNFTVSLLIRCTGSTIGVIEGLASGSRNWTVHSDTGKWYTTNDFTAGFGSTNNNNWLHIGWSKASGSAAVRWHQAVHNGTSWGAYTHGNGATEGDGSTIDTITLGLAFQRMAANFAACALYGSALSDGAFEALGTSSMATWMAAAPGAAWQGNASAVSGILDLTGGGADLTTLVGTAPTLDTVNEPPGWTYYSPASTIDGTATLTGAGTVTTRATLASPSTLTGAGSATALASAAATAALAGAGTLSGLPTLVAGSTLTGTGVLTADAAGIVDATATLTGASTLAALATTASLGALTAAGLFTAKATISPRATLTGVGTFTADVAHAAPDYARRVTVRQAITRVTARP
jgi:hypothetical protein